MALSLKNRVCARCGQPAVDARVDVDGSVTYLCAGHSPAAQAPSEGAPAAGKLDAAHGKGKPNGG